MSGSISFNSPLTNFISPITRRQQVQDLTNEVKKNEDKIVKIDKEIAAREKIIDASEKIIANNEKMIVIIEKMMANNIEAAKAYSKAASLPNNTQTTVSDEEYEKSFQRAMDTSWTVESLKKEGYKGYKNAESIDFLSSISNNPKAKSDLFSLFTEWFNGFKSQSTPFFRWFW